MRSTLVLTRSDVRALLDMDACIAAVDAAFRAHAMGATLPPGVLGTHVPGGGFHVKTAGLGAAGARSYFAAKINANFPANPARRGLPTIQGVISLHDATDGAVLAVLDSMEITTLRTGAATAVAARYLARTDARAVTVLGCGTQGRSQLLALSRVRSLERVFAWDAEPAAAERYANEMARALGCEVRNVAEYRESVAASDLVVTCTGDLSRNRHVGLELGRGRPLSEILAQMHMVAEGVRTTGAALALGARHGLELPITAQMAAVLEGRTSPLEAVETLMGRRQRAEVE